MRNGARACRGARPRARCAVSSRRPALQSRPAPHRNGGLRPDSSRVEKGRRAGVGQSSAADARGGYACRDDGAFLRDRRRLVDPPPGRSSSPPSPPRRTRQARAASRSSSPRRPLRPTSGRSSAAASRCARSAQAGDPADALLASVAPGLGALEPLLRFGAHRVGRGRRRRRHPPRGGARRRAGVRRAGATARRDGARARRDRKAARGRGGRTAPR